MRSGLLALDPAVLATSANPMATLSLIQRDAYTTHSHADERMRRKLAHFRNLFRKGYPAEDMCHLVRILDQILRLDPTRQQVTWAAMHQIEQEETGMNTFISDIEAAAFVEGKAEGEARGEAKGQQHLVLRQLTRRFGLLTPEREAQIRALTPTHVLALADALFDLETLADLDAWFAQL